MQAPSSVVGEEGGEVSRPLRIFQREWKRNKPHLPKSTSLPILQLTPKDRPIFTCCRCGFVNTLIPLCLWCCWTSEAAHKKFELSMPRTRRASAPPRIFWQQNCHSTSKWKGSYITMTSAQTTNPEIKRVSAGDSSPESAEIIPHEHSPDQSCSAQHSTQGEEWRCRRTSNLTLGVDLPPQHHDARYETLFETVTDAQDKVATATSSTLTFFDKPRISRRRSDDSVLYDWAAGISSSHHNRRSTPMPLGTLSARPSTKGVERPTTMHAIKKLSTKSLRSAQLVIDLKNLHESYDILKPDSRNQIRTPKSSTDSPPAQKTLRRKKRMTLFRASTPSSVTSPSVPDSASITSHSPVYPTHTLPVPTKATHTRSQSQPYASVRLGHPSRPYYTAIRPHMSRPSSPVEPADSLLAPSPNPSRPLSLPPPPRAPSPGIFSVLSTTSFLSMPEREPLPLFSSSTSPSVYDAAPRPFAFGSSMSHRSGFSLSGETELRMALAREQEEFGVPAQDRYRYRDMAPATHETRMMKKVNKLKRGLKDLVSRKT